MCICVFVSRLEGSGSGCGPGSASMEIRICCRSTTLLIKTIIIFIPSNTPDNKHIIMYGVSIKDTVIQHIYVGRRNTNTTRKLLSSLCRKLKTFEVKSSPCQTHTTGPTKGGWGGGGLGT
jgi:hypothetical protein